MFTFSGSEKKRTQNFYENQRVKSLYYLPCSFGARSSRCLDRKRKQMLCKKVSYNSCPIIEENLQKNVIYQLIGAKNPMSLVSEMLRCKSIFNFTDTCSETLFQDSSTTAPHPVKPQCHLLGTQP